MSQEEMRQLLFDIAHESWRCFHASMSEDEGKPAVWVRHWPSGARLLITEYAPWPQIRETWLERIYADATV